MEIKKIENCDYVMFPRLQRPGLKPKHIERETFKAELKHVEGHGDYWLLYQQSKPHLVVHVQLPKSEAEFDNILGWCLGQNKWCDYIEGNISFICVIAGFNAAELTPKYPDFIKERVCAHDVRTIDSIQNRRFCPLITLGVAFPASTNTFLPLR